MKVYTRFGDKATMIALIVGVIFCFLACMGIYSYEFFVTQEFWGESVKCLAERDFDCILNIRASQNINKDMVLTMVGANLSVIGVVFGFLIVSLYSFKPQKTKE